MNWVTFANGANWFVAGIIVWLFALSIPGDQASMVSIAMLLMGISIGIHIKGHAEAKRMSVLLEVDVQAEEKEDVG